MRPLLVGSMGGQTGVDLASRKTTEMFVVVDPADAPGLQAVLEESQAGREFDVVTRSGGATSVDPSESPIVLLEVSFPEVGLLLEIAIPVDEYRNSLVEFVRTRRVTLMDSERSIALQSRPPDEAFQHGRSVSVEVEDVKPVIALLQQRIDLPLPRYAPSSVDLSIEHRGQEVQAFLADGVAPTQVGVQYREYDKPSVFLIDPALPEAPSDYRTDVPMVARWAAVIGDKQSVVRLDVFHDGLPFRRLVLGNPDPRIVRAGAAGSHHVMLLREPLGTNQSEAGHVWEQGISCWVEHVEALRALLPGLPAETA